MEDPDGNLWVPDQRGCALRKITPKGEVSTVLGPDVLCDDSVPRENQPFLDNLTWDTAHGELVAGGSRTTARPLHDLYTLVWRIAPDGTYRRVLFGKKVTRVSPSKHHLDGVSAMAVDPKGRIFIISRLMVFEQRGWDELQLMLVDEAGATVVPVSGTKIPKSTWIADHPARRPARTGGLQLLARHVHLARRHHVRERRHLRAPHRHQGPGHHLAVLVSGGTARSVARLIR